MDDKIFEQEENTVELKDDFDIGELPPTEPAARNSMAFAIFAFVAAAFILAFGLILLFCDIDVHTGGLIESPIVNKLIAFGTMLAISSLGLFFGISCLKETIKYYKDKKAMESETVDETVKDEIWKRTCPNCGEAHDIDYPKCPNCKYNYLE